MHACGVSIGAILTQMDDNSQEYVIAFASRLLKGAELHYEITEKECLAVIWAIQKYRIYLYSTKFDRSLSIRVVNEHQRPSW